MPSSRRWALALVGLLVIALGVGFLALRSDDPASDTEATPTQSATQTDGSAPGALVSTTVRSTVGVLLDEIPKGIRKRVSRAVIERPDEFWTQAAIRQLRLTSYRLVFRPYYYGGRRQQLPLPPEPVWDIALRGEPERRTIDGHDVIVVDYRFKSVLVTDEASPGTSEPKLADVGGTWKEPFILPVDPELLLQRTDYACLDEDSFPFGSVDSEEMDTFYDHECGVEGTLGSSGQCHQTKKVKRSCVDALSHSVGKVETNVTFRRLAWDPVVADRYRYGSVTGDEPDLATYGPDFEASRFNYRYIHDDGCEVAEDSVAGTGWRRLLQFSTSDENVGNEPLTIGGVDYFVTGRAHALDRHGLFEFSECHQHFHFKYYGYFSWRGAQEVINDKKGFCLQSTARTANREGSPLHNPFAGCDYQGVEAGWADQYKAGLPNQWLDLTDLPEGEGERSFTSNPEGLLCEGRFVDEDNVPLGPEDHVVWAPISEPGESGDAAEAPLCRLTASWNANNREAIDEVIPPSGQGLITTPCDRGQVGPRRNCGFEVEPATEDCKPGTSTAATFSIPKGSTPQVVRLTEFSHVLNSPIPARYEDAYVPLEPGVSDSPYTLANFIVQEGAPTHVVFRCPSPRDEGADEPGGTYSIYTGPVFPEDEAVPVEVRSD